MTALQIYDPRERRLVAAADRALSLMSALRRVWRRTIPAASPRRILLLRLERIGDLLMVLPAIADVRELAPQAAIDLVVGSWNLALAQTISAVTRVEQLDARWLARGPSGQGVMRLLRHSRAWHRRRYDLAINFEPDIRSNLLLAASGASFTAGYSSGGGGALLDQALEYDARAHTSDNARALVAAVFGRRTPGGSLPPLSIPEAARREAAARLPASQTGPLVGVHVSGGRAIKQWEPDRFADVARRLSDTCGATIVLTGAPEDAALVQTVRSALNGCRVIDVSGDVDLPTLAALLERLDLLVTGDTGPMHLAGAVGTPVVAIFGPSDPARYALRGPHDQVVRVDLPCSPCNRIRLPPERCVGHTPDCLAHIPATRVFEAAVATLTAAGALPPAHAAVGRAPAGNASAD
jgi:ADP-heptose:LPS heptosyltransferase